MKGFSPMVVGFVGAAEFAARYGARMVTPPREVALGADVIVTCLPTSREVEALLEGSDGLLARLAE
ncbi:MAG TPA: NAD(P)-binding domain-containing protein, partial [Gemmatimonadales bacterium]